MFTINTRYGTVSDCVLTMDRYTDNNHIAVSIFSLSEGPYARLTVNLPGVESFPENFSFVDSNNFDQAEDVIDQLGIGKVTQWRTCSGFCTYALYEFDEDKIKEYMEE